MDRTYSGLFLSVFFVNNLAYENVHCIWNILWNEYLRCASDTTQTAIKIAVAVDFERNFQRAILQSALKIATLNRIISLFFSNGLVFHMFCENW